MHDYSKGQSEAFLSFAKKMLRAPERKVKNGVNIIGMTPLDFTATEIRLSGEYELVSNWGINTSYEDVIKATEAELNIAVSSSGIAACKFMQDEYGIPYVKGFPWNGRPCDYTETIREKTRNYIVGEPVISGSVAAYIKNTYGIDYSAWEEELEEALKDAENIIADPMIRLISPANANFIELPHFALSGRLYLKRIPNLMKPDLYYPGI